jgi:hypothetical protein
MSGGSEVGGGSVGGYPFLAERIDHSLQLCIVHAFKDEALAELRREVSPVRHGFGLHHKLVLAAVDLLWE